MIKFIKKILKKRPTETPCPKCGSRFSIDHYDYFTDLIERRCTTCDYQWKVKPLNK